ncbi:MAG TPA: hypothetical protein PLF16_00455 [Candidatus Staskawiczbacteria bacterium]|nr:hypothetical protein [Candidatus Staskawiczbacteria bacterium]
MKYKVKDYAKALAEVLSAKDIDEKKLAAGFVKLLEKQGDLGKAEEILEKAEIFWQKTQARKL